MGSSRKHTDWGSLAALLALTAVFLRVLVPAGFMVGTANGVPAGAIPIVLCSAQGDVQAWLNADGSLVEQGRDGAHKQTDHAPDDPQKHGDCVFAHSVVGPVASDVTIGPIGHSYEVAASLDVLRDLVPGRGLAAPPPPATAPPHLI